MRGKLAAVRSNASRLLLVAFGIAALALLVVSRGGHADTSAKPSDRMTSTDELTVHVGKAIDPEHAPGKPLFEHNCLTCHSGAVPKAPAVVWLEQLAPDAILSAMRGGIMSQEASHLTAKQQLEVAEYLTRTNLADYHPPAPPPQCKGPAMSFTGPPPAAVGFLAAAPALDD